MDKNNFFISLPSSASIKLYPGNTLAKYTTHLDTIFNFEPDTYEVGLAEIKFNAHVENIFGYNTCFTVSTINSHSKDKKYLYLQETPTHSTFTLRKKASKTVSKQFNSSLTYPYLGHKLKSLISSLPDDIDKVVIERDGSIQYLDENNLEITNTLLGQRILPSHEKFENALLVELLLDEKYNEYSLETIQPKEVITSLYIYRNIKEIWSSMLNETSAEEPVYTHIISSYPEINFPGTKNVEHIEFKSGAYTTTQSLLDQLNISLKHSSFYKGLKFVIKNGMLDIDMGFSQLEKTNVIFSFPTVVQKALHLPRQHMFASQLASVDVPPKIADLENQFCYIYCDVIEHTYVGDTRAPLLRSLLLPVNAEKRAAVINFDPIYYLKVSKQYINTLTLEVRDVEGQLIPFQEGGIEVKLHFRKISNY